MNSQQAVILQHGRLGEVLTPPGHKYNSTRTQTWIEPSEKRKQWNSGDQSRKM